MRPELLSRTRPTPLRLIGFVTLALGALVAGLGATMTWATLGFPGDRAGKLDVPTDGIDVWEGRVVLGLAAAVLLATIGMRVVRSPSARRGVGAAIAAAGLAICGLATADLARSDARFGGGQALGRIARTIAARLGEPVDRVRAALEANVGKALRVDAGDGLFVALAGGVLIVVGGVLAIAWANRTPTTPATVVEADDV